jgi:hypothetical protein
MSTLLKYDYFTDEYELIQNTDEWYCEGLFLEVDCMTINFVKYVLVINDFLISELTVNGMDVDVDTRRLHCLYTPLIKEYRETGNTEILVYIIRSLIPLFNDKIVEQSDIDNFELTERR